MDCVGLYVHALISALPHVDVGIHSIECETQE